MSGQHETREEAIVAALDDLAEGGTLFVHVDGCPGEEHCRCRPETWTY